MTNVKTQINKCIKIILFFFFISTHLTTFAIAQSEYVLPYPSAMPGSRFYKIHQIFELLEEYWYFGNFSQFKYNLKLSDKYLVEAKTLFEYKQYLLGYKALKKSDKYINQTPIFINNAKNEMKDVSGTSLILKSASAKHVEVLGELIKNVPEEFVWSPEKSKPTTLRLHKALNEAIKIRQNL